MPDRGSFNIKIDYIMRLIPVLALLIFTASWLKAQGSEDEWPLFRGKSDLAGKSLSGLPDSPALIWTVSTGVRTKSSPVVGNGTIFFGNEKGSIIAVGVDGTIKWQVETGNPLDAPPLLYSKKVIAGSNSGRLEALDQRSGKQLWSYTTENQIAGSANIWKTGTRTGLVVGSYDYYLHCVDPENGKLLWKVETENYINGTPSVASGKVVFGGCDGFLRVVDPETGKQTDTIDIGVYIAASPALASGKAFFGDYNGTKYCVDLSARKIAWKIVARENSGAISGIPAVSGSDVIIGSEDKFIYCLDTKNGNEKWKFRTNGKVTGSPVICSRKVLITSADGYIYILDLADGKKLWSFNTGSPMSSSPAVVKGRFYILTDDGRLLAFGDKK